MSLQDRMVRTLANGLRHWRAFKSFIQPSFAELNLTDSASNRIPKAGFGAYDKYLQAYADETWVYACVDTLSGDVAAAPIYLRRSGADGSKVDRHPVLDLLKNPNGQMDRNRLFKWFEASLLLAGASYWKLEDVDARGMPRSLWPIIPSRMEVLPDKDIRTFIKGYRYHIGDKPVIFGPAEVAQAMLFNPQSYYYGMPPLSACRMSADSHRAATKWNLRFFDNSARPDIVFTTKHALHPDQQRRMAASFNARHRGEDNAHGVTFLQKETTVEVLGISQKDMDFIEQKKMSREEILSVFKMLPAIVGLFEYANYANAQAQEQIYHRGTVIPHAKALCEFLNRRILPLFDATGGLEFFVDESEVKALQEDEEKRSKYVKAYWEMGVSLNQLTRTYKLPFGEVPGGDKPGGTKPPARPGAEDGEPEEEPKPKKALVIKEPVVPQEGAGNSRVAPTAAQIKAKHHRFLLLADKLTGPFREAVRGYFDEQKAIVVAALEKAQSVSTLDSMGLVFQEQVNKLKTLMRPYVLKSVLSGQGSEDLLLKDLTDKIAPRPDARALDRVAFWVEHNVGAWSQNINETTYAELNRILTEGLESGAGPADLAGPVGEAFDAQRDYRTLRIAQTEIIAALNEGALEAYRANDQVEKKGWVATFDGATRDSHSVAAKTYDVAGAIKVDDNFNVGSGSGPAPGQIGVAAEDINCRCSVFPVVKKG